MKLFWSVIAVLVGLAALTLLRPGGSTAPQGVSEAPVASALRERKPARTIGEAPKKDAPAETTPAALAPAPDTTLVGEREGGATEAAELPVRTIKDMSAVELADKLRAEAARIEAERETKSSAAEVSIAETPDPGTALDNALGIEGPNESAEARAEAQSEELDAALTPSASDVAANPAVSEVVAMRSRAGEDGWTILDERFPIRGSGTPEDPYEVSWELLVSASETYQPRLGKNRLPERIALLNGKHVRVTGYVAFPIMAMEQNELLSMRNMWDGCCIGVPPTPYDAIEVRLKKAATGKDRFTAFGVLEGFFKVDPYVKGTWLLGLYLMEDAEIKSTKDVEMPKPTHDPLGF